jgi:hypothetical protein
MRIGVKFCGIMRTGVVFFILLWELLYHVWNYLFYFEILYVILWDCDNCCMGLFILFSTVVYDFMGLWELLYFELICVVVELFEYL